MIKKYVDLKVFPKTRSRIGELKQKLGMTQDGIINHIVLFYLENSNDKRLLEG